jgi:glycosyltransferase involved in cell wall biosynthesis
MIRVLHVVTSLEQGGMENGVCNLATGLESHGIQTHIACLERKGAFAERLPEHINVATLEKKNAFTLRTIWLLFRLISSIRPHLIHTHNLGPLIYSAFATLWGKGCRILHGEHSLLSDWEKSPKRLRQRRILYSACRAIHTVSLTQVPELIPLASSRKIIHTIPNGVDTDRFRPGNPSNARIRLGIPPDALVIGLIGRFGPFKKHDALLAAFELLAAQKRNLHLVFIGSGGSEESRVRALVDASPYSNRIHITGFMADPAPGYHALDLLIIPSTNEGMSNVAIEGMSCGIPVIANNNCGHEQMIEHKQDGFIFDLSTPPMIAGHIESFFASPDLGAHIRVKARNTALLRFSMSRMLSDYCELYTKCIGTT